MGGPVDLAIPMADGERPVLVPIPARPRGILALDIDGTLLGPGDHLGARTRRAVHAAGEAGWLVTLATGRRWGSTKPVDDELGLRVPLIVFNGALIRDSVSAEILHYNPLPTVAIAPLIGILVARGLQPVLFEDIQVGERLLTGPTEHDGTAVGAWLGKVAAQYGEVIERLAYDKLARTSAAVQIMVYDTVERMRGIDALADELGLDYRTILYPDDPDDTMMAELLHAHGTKAVALAALAARYDLTMAEIVAVGDGHNDLEMLAEAGIGVAMGQAPAVVRAQANLTIGGHVDEGLAHFIEGELLAGDGFPHHLRNGQAGR